ncbi:MAG: O-antigen ligase family protein [Trueperaceae bacterium]|nr:MAG: O-antigen ligase family protein [Trueperaceae bacterium]
MRVLVALLIALTGAAFVFKAKLSQPSIPLASALLIFLGLSVISGVFSESPFESEQALLDIFVHISGFFLVTLLASDERKQQVLILALFFAGAVMGLYGVVQYLGYGFTPSVVTDRITSTFYHYSHYAGFLDLAGPVVLGAALMIQRGIFKVLLILLTLLSYANAGLTFSNAGWGSLGLATVLLLLWWWGRGPNGTRRSRSAVVGSLLLVGVLAVGAFVQFSPRLHGTLSQRLVQLLGERDENGTLIGEGLGRFGDRLTIARVTLPIIEEHPWFGVGPGNFIYAVTEFRLETTKTHRYASVTHRFVNYAHNDYLQIASEEGIFALVAFVTFWLLVLFRHGSRSPWLFGGKFALLAILVHGLMDGNLTFNHSTSFLAFMLTGLVSQAPIADAEELTPIEEPVLQG